MSIGHLEQLLDVTGHLKVAPIQTWLTIILEADKPHEFTFSNPSDVTYIVTPTANPIVQGSTRIH